MRSIVTKQFKKLLSGLPLNIQEDAKERFAKWKQNPELVGWKQVAGMRADVYSVEIGLRWRAIGVVSKEHNAVVWVFAGSHETYNKFISSHRKMAQGSWIHSDIEERLDNMRKAKTEKNPAHSARKTLDY